MLIKIKMKTGDLIKYNISWSGRDFIGIVLEKLDGFHLRKSWSDKRAFIEKPMIKIYWLCEPSEKPVLASRQMMIENWPLSGVGGTGLFENTNNTIVDEWRKITEESDWYFCEHFVLIEEK